MTRVKLCLNTTIVVFALCVLSVNNAKAQSGFRDDEITSIKNILRGNVIQTSKEQWPFYVSHNSDYYITRNDQMGSNFGVISFSENKNICFKYTNHNMGINKHCFEVLQFSNNELKVKLSYAQINDSITASENSNNPTTIFRIFEGITKFKEFNTNKDNYFSESAIKKIKESGISQDTILDMTNAKEAIFSSD